MRTVVVDAPIEDVRAAVASLEAARLVQGFGVWVQSPDFDRMKADELEAFVEHMAGLGISVGVLENQEPFPPEWDGGDRPETR